MDRQTDIFAKTIFSGSDEGLTTWTFDKNGVGGGHILHKSNTFSDENVKRPRYKVHKLKKYFWGLLFYKGDNFNFHSTSV